MADGLTVMTMLGSFEDGLNFKGLETFDATASLVVF